MVLIGWMGGSRSGKGPGLWLEEGAVGPALRWESWKKGSFGEILRPVWDPVSIRVPGAIQEVSRALWSSRSEAKRRG